MRKWIIYFSLTFLIIVQEGNTQELKSVKVKLIDKETGREVRAMVLVTPANEKRLWYHPDGQIRTFCRRKDFFTGIEMGDPKTWVSGAMQVGGTGDGRLATVYDFGPCIATWPEILQYMVPPNFSVPLKKGNWRMPIYRGPEYVPEEHLFTMDGENDLVKTIQLERWVNMAEEGWWSGDTHVHHPTEKKAQRDFLIEYAKAVNLNVVNVLEMGHHQGTDFPQQGFGKAFRVRKGDQVLVSGQEDPRSKYGHIVGLNVQSMVRDLKTYDFYEKVFEGLHQQEGALVGLAHFSWKGCDLPRGIHMHTSTGHVDYVELLQFNMVNRAEYYDFLNLGFRIAAAAGSDVPWGGAIGEVRTYVHTGPKLDVDAWFANLRKGRSFVTNGPMIDLTVDGKLPGAVIQLKAGQKVTIAARARSHAKIGLPDFLEVVGNGKVLTKLENPDNQAAIGTSITLKPKKSMWITAFVKCRKRKDFASKYPAKGKFKEQEILAHTSPVYVTVDDRPTWSPEAAPKVIETQLKDLALLRKEFAAAKTAHDKGLRDRIDAAAEFYKNLGEIIKSGNASSELKKRLHGEF